MYYCPNCNADLDDQFGFDPSNGTWTCTECGQFLMDDDIADGDTYDGVAWFCDNCNALLNRQSGKIVPVHDGDIIELGDRPLKIIETPGHTPGSIAILDIKKRRIFTGDPIQDGRIFMFGVQREMHALEILTGGGAKGKREEIFGKPIVSYDMGVATFLCDDTAKEDKKA